MVNSLKILKLKKIEGLVFDHSSLRVFTHESINKVLIFKR